MNGQESHLHNNVKALRVEAPEGDNGRPVPIPIKTGRVDWLAGRTLPALRSRPRCEQETLQMVEFAPRQTRLINT